MSSLKHYLDEKRSVFEKKLDCIPFHIQQVIDNLKRQADSTTKTIKAFQYF